MNEVCPDFGILTYTSTARDRPRSPHDDARRLIKRCGRRRVFKTMEQAIRMLARKAKAVE